MLIIALYSCNNVVETGGYKYRIEYSDGKYSNYDHTDSYVSIPNGIIYTDSQGNKVTRMGTFAIIELK